MIDVGDGPHDCERDGGFHFYHLSSKFYILPCSEQIKVWNSISNMWAPNIPKEEGQQIKALSFGNYLRETSQVNWGRHQVTEDEYTRRYKEETKQ